MKIEEIKVSELEPYEKNTRTHSNEQISQLQKSINEFGFTNPILVDKEGGVIAGHGRLLAAKKMGMKEVPCIRLENLDEKQKRAYVIADNKLAENAGWDLELLKEEIYELGESDFDLNLLGFEPDFIENIFDDSDEKEAIPKENVIEGKDNKGKASLEEYEDSDIRQIILIYGKQEFEATQEAMAEYADQNGLQSNTEVVGHLLREQGFSIPDGNEDANDKKV
tara:strand:- start:908 stop:1576 length:669 start_codon:yes stop_codon:yes gene_type:complete